MGTNTSYRRTAGVARARVALAAALAGVVLAPGPAQAGTVDRIDFSGGSLLDGLVCTSEPSFGELTVPSGARVVFVNRLGRAATLRVDGRGVATVGRDEAVPVLFHAGSAAVSMEFPCRLGVLERYSLVMVAVSDDQAGHGGSAPDPAAEAGPGPVADPGSGADPGPGSGAVPLAASFTVEPATPVPSLPDRTSALLALLASVCVAGVTVAAYRAIIAQRTSRIISV